jgi:hypothetical protein
MTTCPDFGLLRQLEEFTRETFAFSDAITPVPNEVDLNRDLETSTPQSITLSIQPELRGLQLCKELRGYQQHEQDLGGSKRSAPKS